MTRPALLAAAALTLALAPAARAATTALVPPPGFTAPVEVDSEASRYCPPAPPPFTGKLKFPSKYEGSDSARDDLNPRAYTQYREMTAPINEMEKQVSAMVGYYLHTGHPATLRCALDWMSTWARVGALEGKTDDHTGKSVRKWALASLASAWVRLKFSQSRPLDSAPNKVREIEPWLAELGAQVVEDWRDQPIEKINNHEYWAAWAVMATGVALNRRDFFDWAVQEYKIAATQVDRDGYLPNELKRDTRALSYHNYALGPLAMIAAFARANSVDLSREGNGALSRLAQRVLSGVDNPRAFEARTGKKQSMEDLKEASKFAWLEPYCWLNRCDGPVVKKMTSLRPIKAYRLGGDLTELFAHPS